MFQKQFIFHFRKPIAQKQEPQKSENLHFFVLLEGTTSKQKQN